MISEKWQKRISRTMQVILAVLLVSGFYYGSAKVVTNAGIGLMITFVPAIIEKRYDLTISPFLALWITSAVFFHALGSFGFYGAVWWWDHLTHALSASVVTAIGYTAIKAVDLHVEEINLPNQFMFVFILITIVSFGVVWELFEFMLDVIADNTGISMPLAQHGLDDTMKDMMFNLLGATIVAVFGQVYLSERAREIKEELLS